MGSAGSCPLVPVSWGEVLDKITILEIKADRIADGDARANVLRELSSLSGIAAPVLAAPTVRSLVGRLKAINERLWAIEDSLRQLEAAGDFGSQFVALARSVYATNDVRAGLKRELNALLRSELVEEKCYGAAARTEASA